MQAGPIARNGRATRSHGARLSVGNKMVKVTKILWLLMAIGIAIWGIYSGGDSILVAIYALGFLTMPFGPIVYVIGSLGLNLFSKSNPNFGVTFDVAISIVMFTLTIVIGWYQWFILFPRIVRKIKKRWAKSA